MRCSTSEMNSAQGLLFFGFVEPTKGRVKFVVTEVDKLPLNRGARAGGGRGMRCGCWWVRDGGSGFHVWVLQLDVGIIGWRGHCIKLGALGVESRSRGEAVGVAAGGAALQVWRRGYSRRSCRWRT